MNFTYTRTLWDALTRCGQPVSPCSCLLGVCWSAANQSLVLWTFWWSPAGQTGSSQSRRNTERWSPAAETVPSDTAGTIVTPASPSWRNNSENKWHHQLWLSRQTDKMWAICGIYIRSRLQYTVLWYWPDLNQTYEPNYHHEVSVSFPCWCFCFEEVLKLRLVPAYQVLLQFINTVTVLRLDKKQTHPELFYRSNNK